MSDLLRMRSCMGIHTLLCIRCGCDVRVRRAMRVAVSRPVAVAVRMSMIVRVRMGQSLQPRAVRHPQGGGGDQHGRHQLQIGLALRGVPLPPEIQAAHGDRPNDSGVR